METARPVSTARQPAPWRVPAVVLLAGVGGGVLTEWLQGVLHDPWAAWANSVAAWCLVAFAVGALARTVGGAALAGTVVELLLVGGYYTAQAVQHLPVVPVTVAEWLLAGVLVAEGLHRAVAFPWQGSSGAVMAGAGVVLALLLGRTWRHRAAVLAALLLIVPLGRLGTEVVDAVLAAW